MRSRSAAARLLAAVASVLLLSGCYSAELDAEVTEEGTLAGTLFIGVALTAPEGSGEIDGEPIFDETTTKNTFPGAVVEETISEDGYLGQKITFTDAPLDYFDNQQVENALGTRLSIKRDGTEFVVEGSSDTSFITPSTGDGIPDPRIELTLTFPGEVAESNGDITGRTVTWTNPTEMTARAGAAALFPFQLVGIAVGGAVLLVGALIVLVRRRKRGDEPAPETQTEKAPQPSKAKKLPKRRAPKTTPRQAPVAVVAREVIEPPADWWLTPPSAPAQAQGIELGAPEPVPSPVAVRDVAIEDLAEITTSVDEAVLALYGTPEKKRRGR